MRPRRFNPRLSAGAVLTGILIAIGGATLLGMARFYDASKLDTSRFVTDSINRWHFQQAIRTGQQHDSVALENICHAVRAHCP
jgi:hypothetical protein